MVQILMILGYLVRRARGVVVLTGARARAWCVAGTRKEKRVRVSFERGEEIDERERERERWCVDI